MSNIIFTVEIKVKEEYTEMVYTFMQALHKLTHEFDKGCIQYDLYKDSYDSSMFYFIEEWEDEAALEAHTKKDHYKSFMEFVDGKLESTNKLDHKIDLVTLEKFEPIV